MTVRPREFEDWQTVAYEAGLRGDEHVLIIAPSRAGKSTVLDALHRHLQRVLLVTFRDAEPSEAFRGEFETVLCDEFGMLADPFAFVEGVESHDRRVVAASLPDVPTTAAFRAMCDPFVIEHSDTRE